MTLYKKYKNSYMIHRGLNNKYCRRSPFNFVGSKEFIKTYP